MILYFLISRRRADTFWVSATAVLVVAASWLFVNYTPVGQDDNHVLSIGIGGGMGFIMLFNVWGIICAITRRSSAELWPALLLRMRPSWPGKHLLASRTNFLLSVPMIFFMAASSHYTILGR